MSITRCHQKRQLIKAMATPKRQEGDDHAHAGAGFGDVERDLRAIATDEGQDAAGAIGLCPRQVQEEPGALGGDDLELGGGVEHEPLADLDAKR